MAGRSDTVSARVHTLIDAPVKGRGAPSRDKIEATLTEGYAEALALDGERLRLTRKIERMTADLAAGGPARTADLQRLITRLGDTESDLADLREQLSVLRARVARAAA